MITLERPRPWKRHCSSHRERRVSPTTWRVSSLKRVIPVPHIQVLAKNNKPAVAHFNMAYLHFKNGQMTEAQGHLSEAVRFEPQAAGDAAVQRAVERSRDMLAQIDASMAPVAQAAPQATIAGGQYFDGAPQTSPVQQTSQIGNDASRLSHLPHRLCQRHVGDQRTSIKSPAPSCVADA